MSKEGLVPKLRFSGFNEIWVKEKLGNLVEIKSGKSPKNLLDSTGEFPYFKVEQLNNCNKYLSDTPYFINDKSLLVKKGSLIFPKRGMAIMANKIRLLVKDSFMDTNLMTLTTKADKINNEFLFYFLTNEELSRLADTTSVPQLNNKHINPYVIYVPTINEQTKIANFLSIIDKKIELLAEKYQSFLDFKKYLMQQIFAQKLRFDYEIVKLKNISKINKGKQLNKDAMIEDGEYYVLNGGQEPSGYTNEWNTPENTITISEGGNSCGFVNFNEEKFWSGGHCYFLSDLDNQTDTYYLYSYLKFKEEHIMRLRVGSGLPNIQKSDIENFKVQLVSKEEQNKISNLLLSADKKVDFIKNQKENFENFKHGLLQQMFV